MKSIETKDLITWALTVIVLIFVIYTFFKVPNNLKQAMEHIDNAAAEIDQSITLLKTQQVFLDSIIANNKTLLADLEGIKTKNDDLSKNINTRLDNAHNYLYSILDNVKKIPKVDAPD